MLIIGEKINTTRKAIGKAVLERNGDAIRAEAMAQVNSGAHMLDVNCGTFNATEEVFHMKWLIKEVQQAVKVPLCVDSANPEALSAGLAVHEGKAIINSISREKERYARTLPLIRKHHASVVALCLDDKGIPSTREKTVLVGRQLVSDLLDAGIPEDDIYCDPLVRSVATSPGAVRDALFVIVEMAEQFQGIHFVSGLSNVSYGLPERRHLNRAYVVLSIASGLDAVIMDPLDRNMTALIYATEALMGKDRYCLRYIKAYNERILNGE